MATKTPKSSADEADATTKDANAPTTDITEAKNADQNEPQPNDQAEGKSATEQTTIGSTQSTEDAAVTTEAAETAEAKKTPPAAKLPAKIALTCPFGYLDENEQHHFWQAGQTITDPDEIADLIAHGAEHTDISEQ